MPHGGGVKETSGSRMRKRRERGWKGQHMAPSLMSSWDSSWTMTICQEETYKVKIKWEWAPRSISTHVCHVLHWPPPPAPIGFCPARRWHPAEYISTGSGILSGISRSSQFMVLSSKFFFFWHCHWFHISDTFLCSLCPRWVHQQGPHWQWLQFPPRL